MFYNFQLIGDDFFLDTARRSLRFRTHRDHAGVEELGLMKSGLKLKAAAKKVLSAKNLSKNVLIYLGTVDILCGRTFPDLREDFETLVEAMEERQVTPVFCTLAPIANHLIDNDMKNTLNTFNRYLKNQQHLLILDLNPYFLDQEGRVDFNFYTA